VTLTVTTNQPPLPARMTKQAKPDEDEPMDGRQDIPDDPGTEGPPQSRSSSPADRRRARSPTREPEEMRWTHEPVSGAIMHDVDDCDTCHCYFRHFHKGMRDNRPSFGDAMSDRARHNVPIRDYRRLMDRYDKSREDNNEMLAEIEKLRGQTNLLKEQVDQAQQRHEELLRAQVRAPQEPRSFAAAVQGQKRKMGPEPISRSVRPSTGLTMSIPPRQAQSTRQTATASGSGTGAVANSAASTSTGTSTGIVSNAVAGPSRPNPLPAGREAFKNMYDHELSDDDDASDEDLVNPHHWREVKNVHTTATANLLSALQREYQTGTRSQSGREVVLKPQTEAEFQLITKYLDDNEDERVLAAARRLLAEAQKTTKLLRTNLQNAMLTSWRAPAWAKKKKYDSALGAVVVVRSSDPPKSKG
jgi:hypothetical protein